MTAVDPAAGARPAGWSAPDAAAQPAGSRTGIGSWRDATSRWLTARRSLALLIGSLLLVLAAFLLGRLPFFLHYPLPLLTGDSSGYFWLGTEVLAGRSPDFSVRSPGYPLLIAAVIAVSRSFLLLVAVQSLLTLASSAFLVWSVWRTFPLLTLPAGIAMAIFVMSSQTLSLDTTMAPMTLYHSLLITAAGLLLLAIRTSKAGYFAAFSVTVFLIVMARPAGIFMIGAALVVAGFILYNGYPRSMLAALLLPGAVLFGLFMLYNRREMGSYVISAWGEANLAGATFSYWQQDPSYPAGVNADIAAIQARYTEEERRTVRSSDDYNVLSPIYYKGYVVWAEVEAKPLPSIGGYFESRDWIRRVSIDSIWKNSFTYLTFVRHGLGDFFRNLTVANYTLNELLAWRATDYYILDRFAPGKNDPSTAAAMEFSDPPPTPAIFIKGEGVEARPVLASTWLQRLHDRVAAATFPVATDLRWVYAQFLILAIAAIVVLASRFRHAGAFLLLAIGGMAPVAAVTISLTAIPLLSYSHSTQFTYYLTLALAPLLLYRGARPVGVAQSGRVAAAEPCPGDGAPGRWSARSPAAAACPATSP